MSEIALGNNHEKVYVLSWDSIWRKRLNKHCYVHILLGLTY